MFLSQLFRRRRPPSPQENQVWSNGGARVTVLRVHPDGAVEAEVVYPGASYPQGGYLRDAPDVWQRRVRDWHLRPEALHLRDRRGARHEAEPDQRGHVIYSRISNGGAEP